MFCRGRDFATFSLKIQMPHTNCLGAPFVAYEFAWGRILNKYAVISPDKQNNGQKVSDCLSLTRSIFVLLTPLKQCTNLNWPLNGLNHVSHSHLLMSSRIKHYWSFPFFVNGYRHWWDFSRIKTHVVWKIKIIATIVSQISSFFFI